MDAFQLSPAQLRERMTVLRHQADLIEIEFARTAAAFAQTEECDWESSASPADWIRFNCHMTAAAAHRAVNVGEQLTEIPQTESAVVAGAIGFAHLALLAGVARVAVGRRGPGSFDDTALLALARDHSVSRFSFDCTNARHAEDDAVVLDEQNDAHDLRYLELTNGADGAMYLRGRFDVADGAVLRFALEPLAAPCGRHDVRTRGQRLADALTEMADRSAGSVVGTRPHLHITASLDTLMGLPGSPAGTTEFAGAVHTATVQRFACDSIVNRILVAAKSEVLDVGRSQRIAGRAIRDALAARDGGCGWPECGRPESMSAAHHIRHWAHDGPTSLSNTLLLCRRHHRMVHEGGWQLARNHDGDFLPVPPVWRTRHPWLSRIRGEIFETGSDALAARDRPMALSGIA